MRSAGMLPFVAAAGALACGLAPAAGAATITVDTADGSAASDGDCSLREAIIASNRDQRRDGCRTGDGADVIAFDIAGPAVIQPTAQLPDVKRQVTIDGTTEPDFAEVPVVEVNGAGAVITGLETTASGITIKGLAITDFIGEGLRIGGPDNRIQGNLIGLHANGVAEGNSVGVSLETDGNLIGGPGAAARNVISGNGVGGGVSALGDGNRIEGNYVGVGVNGLDLRANNGNGITAAGSETRVLDNVVSGNAEDGVALTGDRGVVRGNVVGLAADGVSPLQNQFGVTASSRRNVIGGRKPAHRNVISNNGQEGVVLDTEGAAGRNRVLGNYIGTDATGTLARANDEEGINIRNSNRNVVGGDERREANVISGNGLGINLSDASRNVISGNLIGLNATATDTLGNSTGGVRLGAETQGNRIGGTRTGEGNVIQFNGGPGVNVAGGAGTSILGNSIFANAGRGIDLGNDGVTPNDVTDVDTGPNGLQNFPEVESYNAVTERLRYSLDSAPNTRFRIELFLSGEEDVSGFGEGERLRRAITVETDGFGFVAFRFDDISGQFKVATATATELGAGDRPGSTSEFSAFVDVSP
jgi:CSLREA domain-containing protein